MSKTYKEICEWIVKTLELPITGLQLFEMSPTGELYHVFWAFELAKLKAKENNIQIPEGYED